MKEFNFNEISKHRTAMMGIATFMIIMCHAPASGVMMPSFLGYLLGLGNCGVDIFLFLSGFGCYYSLFKRPKLLRYYRKRYFRIGIPYLFITIPFVICYLLLGIYSISDAFLSITTMDYWLEHKGAWYIALLVPLYLFSPLFYKILSDKKKWWLLLIMLVCIEVMSYINTEGLVGHNVLNNIQFALQRVPNYFLGMIVGEISKNGVRIKYNKLLINIFCVLILFFLCRYLIPNVFTLWLLVPIFIIVLAKLISFVPSVEFVLNTLGKISLESYLTNISINKLLVILIPRYISSELFNGRYLEYFIVVVLGLLVAVLVNRVSTKILKCI